MPALRAFAGVLALAASLGAGAAQVGVHDPVMAKEGGKFYLYSTGRGISGTLVIEGDKDWKALGHNGAYTFDGKDYLVLHAYETADRYKSKLKVLEMKWDADGWPTVDPKELNRYQSELQP